MTLKEKVEKIRTYARSKNKVVVFNDKVRGGRSVKVVSFERPWTEEDVEKMREGGELVFVGEYSVRVRVYEEDEI